MNSPQATARSAMSRVSARRSSGKAGGRGKCLRPVVPASRAKLAHLDVAKRTPLFRRRRHLASGPIRMGTRQRGMVHVRCLRLQVLLTPQLPGLAAGRTHGCWFRLRRANRPWPAARALRCGRDDFGGSFVLAWSSWLATDRHGIGRRQCLGRVRGRGVDRCRLVLTGAGRLVVAAGRNTIAPSTRSTSSRSPLFKPSCCRRAAGTKPTPHSGI